MEFQHIRYDNGTGTRSREVEPYDCHKSASRAAHVVHFTAAFYTSCMRLFSNMGTVSEARNRIAEFAVL